MVNFKQWIKLQELDGVGPGMSPKIGNADEEGLAYLKPVTDPYPKSKRAKDIEVLFGMRKKEKTKKPRKQSKNLKK